MDPAPPNDSTRRRVAALRSYEILDTLPEREFDDITRLASHICGTPISLITLLDESRQWFKSKVGIEGTGTPIEHAFCAHAIEGDKVMEVADATTDRRFSRNPLVTGEPGIRFYAGAPLATSTGVKIGTLCVIDRKARTLDARQREMLEVLARQVVMQMELRLTMRRIREGEERIRELNTGLERIVAERTAELRQSERFARSSLDALSAHIAVLDENGTIIATNRAWKEFAAGNQLRPESASEGTDYLAVCDRAAAAGQKEAGMAAGFIREIVSGRRQSALFDYECHSASEQRWFTCRLSRFPGDGPLRIVAAHENVTRLKQAYQALKESEERFRLMVTSVKDLAIVMLDPGGNVVVWNKGAEAFHGHAGDQVVGKNFSCFYTPDEARAGVPGRHLAAARDTGHLEDHGWRVRGDGTQYWADMLLTAIRDDAGSLQGYSLVTRDLTEGRRSAADLRHKEELLRAVLENLVEGVVACDAAGELAFFNKAAREWHGCDVRKVPRESWPAIFDLYEADGVTPLRPDAVPLVRAFNGERLQDVGMAIAVKGRAPRFILASGAPIHDAEGSKIGAVVVMHDVSERRDSERQLQRAQRLDSIGTLAGGIAHDLNNALAPVLMVAELLRMKYPDAKPMLDSMEASAQRGAGMVRQLLTFAKGAQGERVAVKLPGMLREMEKMMGSTFPKNIEVRTSIAQSLDPIVGDSTQLHQVLLNLCVNARDAMPDGGTLSLEADNVQVDEELARRDPNARPGRFVVLRVRDTGTGIPPEVLDRLFEPFFSTKGPEKGTGLGLSTLLGIVRSHGGFVLVDTAVGEGSAFSVYLPVAERDEIRTATIPGFAATFRGSGESVLVVDDDASVRTTARTVLEALDFRVLTATDGISALSEVSRHADVLRVVITDLDMARMGGLEFVKVLRHRLPGAGIIVASGRISEPQKQEFRQMGVSAVLDKPFTQEKLISALRKALGRPA